MRPAALAGVLLHIRLPTSGQQSLHRARTTECARHMVRVKNSCPPVCTYVALALPTCLQGSHCHVVGMTCTWAEHKACTLRSAHTCIGALYFVLTASAQHLEQICSLAAGTSSMTRTPSQRVSSPGASFLSATPRARSSRARAASASAPPTSSLEFCRRANPQACVSAQTARRQCARVSASRLVALSVHTLHDSVC